MILVIASQRAQRLRRGRGLGALSVSEPQLGAAFPFFEP
jgi:hypothetical protein